MDGVQQRASWLVTLCAALLQLFLQAQVFPLSALNDDQQLLHIDSAFHQYQMEVARQLCAEGQVSGFDPLFAAGQVAGLVSNASAKLQAVFACVAGTAAAVGPVYKHISFWQGVAAPALAASAAALFGLGPMATAVAALLAMLGWWTGGVRWYHTAGMVSYVISAYLTLPFVVAFWRCSLKPSWGGAFGVALVGAVGMWIHPLFPLGAVLAGGPLLAMGLRSRSQLGSAAMLAVAGLVAMLLLNHVWIVDSMRLLGASGYQQPYQRAVVPDLPLLEMLGRAPTAGGGLRLGSALLAGVALSWMTLQGPLRPALLGLVVGGTLLMTWAAVGALIPGGGVLQPNRFSVLAWLCLLIPAAAGLSAAPASLFAALSVARGRRVVPAALMAALIAAAVAVSAFAVWEAQREILASPGTGRYAVAPPEVKGSGPVSKQIVQFLQQRTQPGARVLFETSMARVHDGAHMAGLYALAASREFVGGPYPHMDFASAWDGFAMGARYEQRTPQALASLLDTYNVRWMLCHSASCKQAMRALPLTSEVAQLGPVSAFERASSPGYVIQGTGRVVQSCINRVEIVDASGSPLVLRYHWVPGLRSEPSGRVVPVPLLDGARPFVAIHDPPPNLVLKLGPGPGRRCESRADAWR